MPEDRIFKEFKQNTREFIWGNKQAKVAYDKLILPIEKGGLQLADLKLRNTAIKCTWVSKSIIKKDADLVIIANKLLP